jgi:hypothetical protein
MPQVSVANSLYAAFFVHQHFTISFRYGHQVRMVVATPFLQKRN